jgi:hypothetical protein
MPRIIVVTAYTAKFTFGLVQLESLIFNASNSSLF